MDENLIDNPDLNVIDNRDLKSASEKTLITLWDNHEEDEAWRDL